MTNELIYCALCERVTDKRNSYECEECGLEVCHYCLTRSTDDRDICLTCEDRLLGEDVYG